MKRQGRASKASADQSKELPPKATLGLLFCLRGWFEPGLFAIENKRAGLSQRQTKQCKSNPAPPPSQQSNLRVAFFVHGLLIINKPLK